MRITIRDTLPHFEYKTLDITLTVFDHEERPDTVEIEVNDCAGVGNSYVILSVEDFERIAEAVRNHKKIWTENNLTNQGGENETI